MEKSILVIGGTGYLGGKVIKELLARKVKVSALVRPDTDPKALEVLGVHIISGDITHPITILPALNGIDAVVSTAIGYSKRKKGDSLQSVDDAGNRNLVDALSQSTVKRFVFTSILTADKAMSVPHFWQKKLIEDYMDQKGLKYVALRPGAFLDQNPARDQFAASLRKGKLKVPGSSSVKWTYILTTDLARYLAIAAIDETIPLGKIDIGMEEPMNAEMLAEYAHEYTGKPVKLSVIPWSLLNFLFSVLGPFVPFTADMKKMFEYFMTGQYVADTTNQQKYFGEVPTVKDSAFRYFNQIGLRKGELIS
ncbi:MAG: SDR family oxidoreductase [Paludibacter sp.]|nr:SDR family oxidoreductase [Paludibacter sp.]